MPKTKNKTQKIIKVGNSYAVTLDKKFVDQAGWQVNETIVVQYDSTPKGVKLSNSTPQQTKDQNINSRRKNALASKITPELKEWVDNFIEENQEALDKLAVS